MGRTACDHRCARQRRLPAGAARTAHRGSEGTRRHADAAQDFTADELTELWRIVLLPDSGPVVVPPEPVAAEPGPEALLTDAFPGAEVAGPSIEERFAVIARKLKTTTPSSPVGAAAKVITAKVRRAPQRSAAQAAHLALLHRRDSRAGSHLERRGRMSARPDRLFRCPA